MKAVGLCAGVLLLAFGAQAALVNESTCCVDFSNANSTPTLITISSLPGVTTNVVGQLADDDRGPLPSNPIDGKDLFIFNLASGISSITLDLTGTTPLGQPFDLQKVDIYSPNVGPLPPADAGSLLGHIVTSGDLASLDLLAAWGLGSGLPSGTYAIKLKVNPNSLFTGFRGDYSVNITAAPEPTTYVLVGFGLLGLAFFRRRRKA